MRLSDIRVKSIYIYNFSLDVTLKFPNCSHKNLVHARVLWYITKLGRAKTASMEKGGQEDFVKRKYYLRLKMMQINKEDIFMKRHKNNTCIYIYICMTKSKHGKEPFPTIPDVQTNCLLKLGLRNSGGAWMIKCTKHHNRTQLQSLEHPCTIYYSRI